MAKFRRQASPQFDWRRSPEHDSPGISTDHHTAPLENGDSLHVYRLDLSDHDVWMHELRPHDLPMRFPIPRNPFDESSDWNVKINKPGFDRRNQQYIDDNGSPITDKETAMERAEQKYKEQAPSWDRPPHSSDVDYEDIMRNYKDYL